MIPSQAEFHKYINEKIIISDNEKSRLSSLHNRTDERSADDGRKVYVTKRMAQ